MTENRHPLPVLQKPFSEQNSFLTIHYPQHGKPFLSPNDNVKICKLKAKLNIPLMLWFLWTFSIQDGKDKRKTEAITKPLLTKQQLSTCSFPGRETEISERETEPTKV